MHHANVTFHDIHTNLCTITINYTLYPLHHQPGDEPPHQIHSYTLLFSLFLHFLYIVNPPLCTSALTRLHVIALTLASLDQSHLFDGHMIYDSHVFTSILSISNMPPPTVQPITSLCTTQSGTSLRMSLMLTFLFFIHI